jgi:hypothetical protein
MLSACGTAMAWMPLNEPPHPLTPKTTSAVELFQTQTPEKPYVEVGMIQAGLQSAFSSADEFAILDQIRTDAARRGCDGVIITGRDKRADVSEFAVSERTQSINGTCIVYK